MITPPPTDEVARRHALHAPFGSDAFGRKAEAFARFFGTATFLIGQTLVVAAWIVLNATGVLHFDVYPFILLNLAFSTQAAYAAPLILLAQTRQADRDKAAADMLEEHRDAIQKSAERREDEVRDPDREAAPPARGEHPAHGPGREADRRDPRQARGHPLATAVLWCPRDPGGAAPDPRHRRAPLRDDLGRRDAGPLAAGRADPRAVQPAHVAGRLPGPVRPLLPLRVRGQRGPLRRGVRADAVVRLRPAGRAAGAADAGRGRQGEP